jgi:hypothetical protein
MSFPPVDGGCRSLELYLYAVVRLKDEETVIGNVISRSFRTVLASSFFNGQSHLQRSVSCVTADLGNEGTGLGKARHGHERH